MDIGTPSSTFLSEPTEGLTRFCSISEMRPLVTPARRASSRCDRPCSSRTCLSRAPTSYAHDWDYDLAQLPESNMAAQPEHTAPSLDAYWMPFTANRQFKQKPRMLARASGMYYETPEGRKILDGVAGLWCVNAGHGRKEITQAVAEQLEVMDYAPAFQIGHPAAFELANALVRIAPAGLDHVFFTNSGSESVDTALKIALAYHRVKGDAGAREVVRPRARLSRRGIRRHQRRRHDGQSQGLADGHDPGRRSPGAHARHQAQCILARTAGARRGARRRSRAAGDACTMPRPLPPSSSSPSPDPPAWCCRRRVISSGCARSATSTASC